MGLPKACWLLPWALDAEVSSPDRINKAALSASHPSLPALQPPFPVSHQAKQGSGRGLGVGWEIREEGAALVTVMMESQWRDACHLHEVNEARDPGQKSLLGASHPGSQPLTLWGTKGIGVGSF